MLCNENFILPKSLYVCMIRYHDEDKAQGGEVRFQREETRQKDFGRPTHFGRPILDEYDTSVYTENLQNEDGCPLKFGHPRRRTSESGRTSDISEKDGD